ncbi:hypothetical protein EB151_00100 [archaeon]|nr:hypothetical protein [archaeon]
MVRFTTQHFDPFLRSSIGFDHLLRELDNSVAFKGDNYPPYNIIKGDEETYTIELAVSGFSEDELSVEVKENTLTVTGTKTDIADVEYLHKGIGGRNFERKFTLAADLVVTGAEIVNGILTISMELVVPEHKKPRTIEIGTVKKSKNKKFLAE